MDFSQLLSLRQSTRKFRRELPSREELQKIIGAANRAPIGSNRYEDIHLTGVEDQQKLLYLCEAAWKRFSSRVKNKGYCGRYCARKSSCKNQPFL